MRRPLLPLTLIFTLAPLAARAQPTPAQPDPGQPEPAQPEPAQPEQTPDGQPPDGTAPVPAATPVPAPVPTADPPPPPPAPVSASDFMDTRLSFTCTHEDMLRDERVLPTAPGFHCGRPNALGILFFDNYDTRFSGFETLTHLVLYKRVDRGRWDVEGALVIRDNELAEETIRRYDGGSYIRAAYHLDATRADKSTIALVAFPGSSDRMRLGYSYRISWGGSPEFFKPNPDVPGSSGKNPDPVPGFKIQYDSEKAYGYLGFKSSLLRDPQTNEKRSVLAGLFGFGVDVSDMIHLDLNGGVFDRGKNELEDVNSERVVLYGLSAQLALHSGMGVGSSIDYKLYRNDPEAIGRLFRPEAYPAGVSWLVSTEGTLLRQTLKDPSAPGSTTTQQAFAGDVNLRVKVNFTRFRLDAMVRDLAYILHSTPSLPTYTQFAEEYDTTPELFAAAGVDHYFAAQGVTAGVTFGVDIPATLGTPKPSDIPGNLSDSTTLVVRNENNLSVLPAGEKVAAIIAVKASARIDFAESFAALADVYYQYDANIVRYERDMAEGTFHPVFANFNQLGFNLTLQARF